MECGDNVANSDNQKMVVKLEIKEEPICANETLAQVKTECEEDVDFHSETVFVSSPILKESTGNLRTESNELYNKTEIKEEHCTPTEVKHEVELAFADTEYGNLIKETSQTDKKCTEDAPGWHSESLCRNSKSPFYKNSRENHWENVDSDITKATHLLTSIQQQISEQPETNSTLDSGVKDYSSIQNCKQPYKNETCGKSFEILSDLKKRVTSQDRKQLTCEIYKLCQTHSSNTKYKKLIHKHKRLHTCEICKNNFSRASTLKEHKLIHEGKRPHICEICKKSFTQASTMKQHKLIHEGKRPHTCNICNKSFTLLSNMKKHKLIHAGIRPHTCDICNQSFTLASTLKDHKLIHEGKKPHTCEICKRKFTQSSTLKQHKLTHMGK